MIVDNENKPEKSILFVTSIIIKIMRDSNDRITLLGLYEKYESYNLPFMMFYYSMDWLFVMNKISSIDSEGVLTLCD